MTSVEHHPVFKVWDRSFSRLCKEVFCQASACALYEQSGRGCDEGIGARNQANLASAAGSPGSRIRCVVASANGGFGLTRALLPIGPGSPN